MLGLLLPLALQTVATVGILWIQRRATWDYVSPIAIFSFIATSAVGFSLVTRRYRRAIKVAVAIGYFPTMFILMSLESLYLDARIYGNNF